MWMLEIVSKKSRHLTSIPDPIPHLCKKDDHLELGRGVLHELAHLKNCNCWKISWNLSFEVARKIIKKSSSRMPRQMLPDQQQLQMPSQLWILTVEHRTAFKSNEKKIARWKSWNKNRHDHAPYACRNFSSSFGTWQKKQGIPHIQPLGKETNICEHRHRDEM